MYLSCRITWRFVCCATSRSSLGTCNYTTFLSRRFHRLVYFWIEFPMNETPVTPSSHWAGTAFLSQTKKHSKNRSVCKKCRGSLRELYAPTRRLPARNTFPKVTVTVWKYKMMMTTIMTTMALNDDDSGDNHDDNDDDANYNDDDEFFPIFNQNHSYWSIKKHQETA